jgi:hypothetical protein
MLLGRKGRHEGDSTLRKPDFATSLIIVFIRSTGKFQAVDFPHRRSLRNVRRFREDHFWVVSGRYGGQAARNGAYGRLGRRHRDPGRSGRSGVEA